MNFCCKNKKNFKYEYEVPELIIDYHPKSDTTLYDFVKSHPYQRIIMQVAGTTTCNIKLLKEIQKTCLNTQIAVALDETSADLFEALRGAGIPAFFNNYVRDYDTLQGYARMGVSDVYVVEALGFALDNVSSILRAHNCRMRCIPNIAQSAYKDTPPLRKFFIRPEDIPYYSTFVDTFELVADPKHIETLYHIYAIEGKYSGPLNEIIAGLGNDFTADNRCIDSMFFVRRATCKKKCFSTNHDCKICDSLINLAKVLEDNNLIIEKNKKI